MIEVANTNAIGSGAPSSATGAIRKKLHMAWLWWYYQSNVGLSVITFILFAIFLLLYFWLYSFVGNVRVAGLNSIQSPDVPGFLPVAYDWMIASAIYVVFYGGIVVIARSWGKLGSTNNSVYFYALKGLNSDKQVLREYLERYEKDCGGVAANRERLGEFLQAESRDLPSYHVGMFFVKSPEASLSDPSLIIRHLLQGLQEKSRAPINVDPGFSFEYKDGALVPSANVMQRPLGGRRPVVTDWSSFHASFPRYPWKANPEVYIYFDAENETPGPVQPDDYVSHRHRGEINVRALTKSDWPDRVRGFIGSEFEQEFYWGAYHDFPGQFSNRRGPAFIVRLKSEKADAMLTAAVSSGGGDFRTALKNVVFEFCKANSGDAKRILDER